MTTSISTGTQQVQVLRRGDALKALFDAVLVDLTAIQTALKGTNVINVFTLSKGSTPENVATTAGQFRIDGVTYTKAAVPAGTAFSAADTINTAGAAGKKWGAWNVQIVGAGTITTKAVGADQSYTTEALAIAALPAVETGKLIIGYVTVQAKEATKWTAGTDDLTAASDCTGAFYYSTSSSPSLTLSA